MEGIGFLGLLAILFIALKLIGIINWSWLWVLIPLWGPVVTLLIFAIAGLFAFMIVWIFEKSKNK